MASRSTFREAAGDVAWQRQLRDRYADEPAPPVAHLDIGRALVRPVSRRTAEQVILKYEWLGTMATTSLHFGLFFGSFCAGVTCVGTSTTGGFLASRSFGVQPHELLTLARGACVHWAPPGSNSKLIAWTARLLARDRTAKLMIAYADTDAGEIGTVYQAAGWVYIGRGQPGYQYIAPNGRVYDMKIVYDTRRTAGATQTIRWADQRDALLAAGWTQQRTNPKHRYVVVLDRSDRALVERIEAMRQPYPKREPISRPEHPGDAPAVQAGEGGSTPTRTLRAQALSEVTA
jgi:hypothetical protein